MGWVRFALITKHSTRVRHKKVVLVDADFDHTHAPQQTCPKMQTSITQQGRGIILLINALDYRLGASSVNYISLKLTEA